MSENVNSKNNPDSQQQSPIAQRRDRTPSIVVQSLGLSNQTTKDISNLTESLELSDREEDNSSQSNSSEPSDTNNKSNGVETAAVAATSPARGSISSLKQNNSSSNSIEASSNKSPTRRAPIGGAKPSPLPSTTRRLSLTISSTAPRRQSLTVDGLSNFVNPALKEATSNATGSLRNKVALKPGHSLMGWTKLAAAAKDLSGTNGKIIEVTPDELAKHNKDYDCWLALKGNVYNVTPYLQFHPGGVEELMKGAGRDATELFEEVHQWVNYESILAKCLVGPFKLESP